MTTVELRPGWLGIVDFARFLWRIPQLLRDEDRRHSCERKVELSESNAWRAATRMAAKHGRPFDAYKCRHCEGWHVGRAVDL